MYISETSRHVFHSEKGSLHAGKRNGRIEEMATQVWESVRVSESATREWSRRSKLIWRVFPAVSLWSTVLWSHTNTPHPRCGCTHAWDALLSVASRGHSVQDKGSEEEESKVVLCTCLSSEMKPLCRRIVSVFFNVVQTPALSLNEYVHSDYLM